MRVFFGVRVYHMLNSNQGTDAAWRGASIIPQAKRYAAMRRLLLLCCTAGALQPAAHRPSPCTRRHAADGDAPAQQDPVLEVERLEYAIAAATEPAEQKKLADELSSRRMSAEMSVLSANAAFYDAFQSCDVAQMKGVWSDSDDVTCVHPGHPLIGGADRVLNSWRALFASGGMPPLRASRQRVVLRGAAAWVTCTEAPEGDPGGLEALNIFERRAGRWFMVHHGAAPIFVQAPPE